MKISNSIGWCDETTNAVTGCDKVSPGCKNCYAAVGTRARVLRSQGIETWGPNGVRHPVAQFAAKIRALNKKCVCDVCHEAHSVERFETRVESRKDDGCHVEAGRCDCGGNLRRIRLFADSNSDWLDEKLPIEVFANFLKEIHDAPNVDVLLLTKRPQHWSERLHLAMRVIHDETDEWISGWLDGDAPANVWIGVSVENQAMADLRIPQVLAIPAVVRFLSCEPLLERIQIHRNRYGTQRHELPVDWVIVGGESGKHRRDCGMEAIVSVAEQCVEAGVPVYVKQDCDFKSGKQGRIPDAIWALKQFPAVAQKVTKATEAGR